jgi:uncharacterized protein (TIGR03086 family)
MRDAIGMSERADRWSTIAGRFTEVVGEVPAERWDSPAPCEGWVARDVVRHLVEWVPGFFSSYAGIELPAGPSVDDDPAAAWAPLHQALGGMIDDERTFEMRGATYSVGDAVDMFVAGDLLIHTWDIARAASLDETLDADEVHRALVGMEPMDEALRASGHYGPKVDVPADADEQTRLIAFTGRTP